MVGTDYLFSSRARPENLFPGKSRTEYLFSTATYFLKSKKKKKKEKEKMKGGGGVSARVKKRGQDMALHVCITFCRLLACNIVYLVAGMF